MKRGDVVAFDYPFSDGTGSKIRPALVVQANAIAGNDLILAMISGTCDDQWNF
jgi:mRNA-degrading endonuclease toxin of MazEF toxin-antitoxin module